MKKKVIVYGLGHDFEMDYKELYRIYDIIGYSDKDEDKMKKEWGIEKQFHRNTLHNHIQECDSDCRLIIVYSLFLLSPLPPSRRGAWLEEI